MNAIERRAWWDQVSEVGDSLTAIIADIAALSEAVELDDRVERQELLALANSLQMLVKAIRSEQIVLVTG